MFNNAYYKNFVKTSDWFIQSWDDDTCTLLGDARGNIPDVKWVPTFEGFTQSGGPMHWIRSESQRCSISCESNSRNSMS